MSPQWTPYDNDARDANPLPKPYVEVWVFDEFYEGVTIGMWCGKWWETYATRNWTVTHWQPITKPDPPVLDEAVPS
jgi:hypothetical protein